MTWKLSLPCSRREAEAIAAEASFAEMADPPTLVTSEAAGGRWQVDAYFEARPGPAAVEEVRRLVPGAAAVTPERVPDEDWVTLSQAGLEPIRAGRFFVHTPAHRSAVPGDVVALEIDAGLAFGTGQHATTAGCLVALDRLKRTGFTARNFIDVGTGTGLLAFAALRLWPGARATGSDNDAVAVGVAQTNARVNGVGLGQAPGRLDIVAAAGLDHPRLRQRGPYDLIIANILAGPLIALAPSLAPALVPGGRLILAGLLGWQAPRVAAVYCREGLRPLFSEDDGEWPTLVLRRPRA